MPQRRDSDRYQVFLPALCWSRRHPDFYAVTEGISVEGIALRSAVVPEVGEALTCSIRHIGVVDARIAASEAESFVVRLSISRPQAVHVARTMVALARAQHRSLDPHRVHRRIAPDRKDITVTFDDGRTVPGRLINVSASGAALALERPVGVGTAITIGATAARVVRLFERGVGAVFAVPLDPALVDAGIRL